jgi:hypothetical protein
MYFVAMKKERIFQLVKKHFKRAGKLNFIFIAFSLTVAGKSAVVSWDFVAWEIVRKFQKRLLNSSSKLRQSFDNFCAKFHGML